MSRRRLLGCALVLLLGPAVAVAAAPAELSPLEQLGKELFFDRISSPDNQACAACHAPDVGWTGPIAGLNQHGAVYPGANRQRFGNRKPPSSAYMSMSPVFELDEVEGEFVGGVFWDGRATGERLGSPAAEQALGPFLNPVEQNNPDRQSVCRQVASSRYASLFEEVWGAGSLDCSEFGVEAMYDRIGLSIAAYEASAEVNPFSSKFDLYWARCIEAGNTPEACGLAEGPKPTLDPYGVLSPQEFDGLIEFGEYCAPCHTSHEWGPNGEPPLFTDFRYDNIGVPRNPENPFYDMDEVYLDDGSPINPMGDAWVDFGLGAFLRQRAEWSGLAAENDGKFKVPTLRNVDLRRIPPNPPGGKHDDGLSLTDPGGLTKAYMHNGVFKSLEEVVHFYNTRDVPGAGWPPPEVGQNVNRDILEGVPLGDLQLDHEAEMATVAFLRTLNDGWYDPAAMGPLVHRHRDGGAGIEGAMGRSLQLRLALSTGELYFELPYGGVVEGSVYDLMGRRIASLGMERLPAGPQSLHWDGRDRAGRPVANGVYLFRVRTALVDEVVKGVWLR